MMYLIIALSQPVTLKTRFKKLLHKTNYTQPIKPNIFTNNEQTILSLISTAC